MRRRKKWRRVVIGGGIECLEPRVLLAGDLVAQWRADDLIVDLENGQTVTAWSDSIAGIAANATGTPTLVGDAIGGRAVVRLDASDGKDSYEVASANSPLSAADDFSIAVLFSTDSQTLEGGDDNWQDGAGLVHANQLGFAKDWGISLNASGQIGAGIGGGFGRPSTSVFSTTGGYNDGEAHLVVFTRQADELSVYIDGGPAVVQAGADDSSRVRIPMVFGVDKSRSGELSVDLAEVRIYDGALDAEQAAGVFSEITRFYNNSAPIAADDQYVVTEDKLLFVSAADGVLPNDTDAEGDALTVQLIDSPDHGELSLSSDGSFLYGPRTDFHGTDTFTYAAVDFRSSNVATVTVVVEPAYDAAVGSDDLYKTAPDRALNVAELLGVLSNDENTDGLPLTSVLEDDVTFGDLKLSADGSFTFDPRGNAGQTQFTYRIDDTFGQSAPVTVQLIVNSIPAAIADRYQLSEDELFQVSAEQGVLANDFDADADPLQLTLVTPPEHVELALQEDGAMLIVPNVDYFGLDQFTYQVTDGVDPSRIATVTLDIRPSNDPPEAKSDAYFVDSSNELLIDGRTGLLANDRDVDDAELTVGLVAGPEHGDVQLTDDGAFQYRANPGFVGEDSFTYRVSDAAGDSDQAEVVLFVGKPPVVISEFVAANVASLLTTTRLSADESFPREDTSPDWIEIQNQTSAALDLSGFHLSDDPENLLRWQFPAGTTISPNGYLIVFASGKNIIDPNLDENGFFHTNFKLDGEGDFLVIASPNGNAIHQYDRGFPRQLADVSYGIVGDQWRYMPEPSPGADANEGIAGIVDQVDVSVPSGYFAQPIVVELSARTAGSTIRYTLDGSEPTLSDGMEYAGPISIGSTTIMRSRAFREDLLPSTVLTHSYLFLDDVLTQSSRPDGFPTSWGVAGAADYEIDPRIATDTESGYYDPNLRAALQSHPSISLVTDSDHLFDRTTGIYSNPQRDGVAWERPASMEYFTADGQLQVQINAGLRIQGGASRNPNRPKHNMRLLFKEQYGPGKLAYPVFEESDVDQFDTMILRGGNGDSWFHPNATQQRQAQYIRDQWHRDTQRAMGRMTTDQRYVHLYINGLYWGLYHTFEKPNAAFFAEHFGGEPEEYDVLQHQGGTVDGNRDAWNDMMRIARTDLETEETYEQIKQYMDIPSLIDYLLINFYSGNVDWDQNNWFGGRKREPGVQFRFFTWDAERTFLSNRDDRTTVRNANQPSDLHQRLTDNDEYRLLFADHVHRHFFNDGVLTPESAEARWVARAEEIELPLVAESARWGDSKRRSRPYTVDGEWRAELNRLRTTYFPSRTETVLSRLVRRDLYPEVAAPAFNQHGGEITAGFELTVQAPAGTIYYTVDGTDPRVLGGEVAATAQVYEETIVLGGDTTVKARVLHEGEWSALNEALFLTPVVDADATSLRISEIHYHPGDPSEAEIAAGFDDSDEFEFIELVNISDRSIDLSKVRLRRIDDQGVDFDFSTGAIKRLASGQRVLVVENQDAFAVRYGNELPVAGQWLGRLSNGGEMISLWADNQAIHQFAYDDNWHDGTDGVGASLEIVDEAHSDLNRWALGRSWRASSVVGGTPGFALSTIPGDSNRDGQFDSSDLVFVFQVGEYEDGLPLNSTFEEGDWNDDGDFDSGDFVFAFQRGTYLAAATPGQRPVWLDPLVIDRLFGGDF